MTSAIKNVGDVDAWYFYVDFYSNSKEQPEFHTAGDLYTLVTTLMVGEELTIEWTDFEPDCLWATLFCESWILADSFDEIEESDETNNVAWEWIFYQPI